MTAWDILKNGNGELVNSLSLKATGCTHFTGRQDQKVAAAAVRSRRMYRRRIRNMKTVAEFIRKSPHSTLILLSFRKCENPVALKDRAARTVRRLRSSPL
jgi:hypothetical protein